MPLNAGLIQRLILEAHEIPYFEHLCGQGRRRAILKTIHLNIYLGHLLGRHFQPGSTTFFEMPTVDTTTAMASSAVFEAFEYVFSAFKTWNVSECGSLLDLTYGITWELQLAPRQCADLADLAALRLERATWDQIQ